MVCPVLSSKNRLSSDLMLRLQSAEPEAACLHRGDRLLAVTSAPGAAGADATLFLCTISEEACMTLDLDPDAGLCLSQHRHALMVPLRRVQSWCFGCLPGTLHCCATCYILDFDSMCNQPKSCIYDLPDSLPVMLQLAKHSRQRPALAARMLLHHSSGLPCTSAPCCASCSSL